MRTLVAIIAALIIGIALIAIPLGVSAHHTGNECRTPAQCKNLGAAREVHCRECVNRPRPHHYHPRPQKGRGICHLNIPAR